MKRAYIPIFLECQTLPSSFELATSRRHRCFSGANYCFWVGLSGIQSPIQSGDSEASVPRAQPALDEDIAHAPEPVLGAGEAFARTAEREIQAEMIGMPAASVSADWDGSLVVDKQVAAAPGDDGRQPEGASLSRTVDSSHWTVYSETVGVGPKCFLPGTQFLLADGTSVVVDVLRYADELQGPDGNAVVEAIALRAMIAKISGVGHHESPSIAGALS